MATSSIRRVDYYYVTTTDHVGEAYRALLQLKNANVNLLAFNIMPIGPEQTQFVLFPEVPEALATFAEKEGLTLYGPHKAFIVQGEDKTGALVDLHEKLATEGVDVYAANGVVSAGGYGYVLYVRAVEYEKAARVLGV